MMTWCPFSEIFFDRLFGEIGELAFTIQQGSVQIDCDNFFSHINLPSRFQIRCLLLYQKEGRKADKNKNYSCFDLLNKSNKHIEKVNDK